MKRMDYFFMDYGEDIKIPTLEEENTHYESFKKGKYTIVVRKTKITTSHGIKGKNIVFTGRGPYKRSTLIKMAREKGALYTSNTLSKVTDILVVGEKPGSKLIKARNEKIEIMSMEDFLKEVEK